MNILIINAGSSSLKFQYKNCSGIVDSLGSSHCFIKAEIGEKEVIYKKIIKNHQQALKEVLQLLEEQKLIKNLKDITATGHRVVHGGEKYKNPTRINKQVKEAIKQLAQIAPLHNPANLLGIVACEKYLPHAQHVAVFDTSFHQTLPEKAFKYAIPEKYYKKYKIRKYGFHGISHHYVSQKAYKLLGSKKGKIIVCHLGNGSSITAIKGGQSADTSMGFTPLEGIPMGTRSGSIDPAILQYIEKKEKLSIDEITNILNNESGLKALSELNSDMRIIWAKAQKKHKKSLFAIQFLAYKIAQYIGAYAATLNGVNALVFTGGIGENAWYLRKYVTEYLGFLGLKLDQSKNKQNKTRIHQSSSKVKVFVIPTNEATQILYETKRALRKG